MNEMKRQNSDQSMHSIVIIYGAVLGRIARVRGEDRALQQMRLATVMERAGGYRPGAP
jgi:hypothetical protein